MKIFISILEKLGYIKCCNCGRMSASGHAFTDVEMRDNVKKTIAVMPVCEDCYTVAQAHDKRGEKEKLHNLFEKVKKGYVQNYQ